jgi:hypothetical protein
MPPLRALPKLEVLDVTHCESLGEGSLRAELTNLASLRELHLGAGTPVGNETVEKVRARWRQARVCGACCQTPHCLLHHDSSVLWLATLPCLCPQVSTSLTNLTKLVLTKATGLTLAGCAGFAELRELDLSNTDGNITGQLTATLEGCRWVCVDVCGCAWAGVCEVFGSPHDQKHMPRLLLLILFASCLCPRLCCPAVRNHTQAAAGAAAGQQCTVDTAVQPAGTQGGCNCTQ